MGYQSFPFQTKNLDETIECLKKKVVSMFEVFDMSGELMKFASRIGMEMKS